MSFDHPLVQSLAVPFIASLVLSAILWRLVGRHAAVGAIGLAMLCSLWATLGLPAWPATGSAQKLPWAVLVLSLIALVAACLPRRSRMSSPVGTDTESGDLQHGTRDRHERGGSLAPLLAGALIAIVMAGWYAGAGLLRSAPADAGVGAMFSAWVSMLMQGDPLYLGITVATVLAVIALAGVLHAPADGTNRPVMLILAALALAGASAAASSLSLAQISVALAAAIAGFSVLTWPRPRLPATNLPMVCITLMLFAVVLALLIATRVTPWALALLVLVFATDRIATLIPLPSWISRRAGEPLLILALALAPVAATTWFAAPASTTAGSETRDDYR